MKLRPRIRKRFTLLRVGKFAHVWVNLSKRGKSLSVKVWRGTWNSRTGAVSLDGPGILNGTLVPDRDAER